MKILFITAYDEQTKSNLIIADQIKAEDDTLLFEINATRENLHKAILNSNCNSILVMCHGDIDVIKDNFKNYAINIADEKNFTNKFFYVWACNTAKELGKKVANNDNVWWGYDCPVTAPTIDSIFLVFFVEIFKEIKLNFSNGINKNDIINILDLIKIKCEWAENEFDFIINGGVIDSDGLDIISLYSCSRNIWANLCVWYMRDVDPIKHPEAPKGFIEI